MNACNVSLKESSVSSATCCTYPKDQPAGKEGKKIYVPVMVLSKNVKKGEELVLHYEETGQKKIKRVSAEMKDPAGAAQSKKAKQLKK